MEEQRYYYPHFTDEDQENIKIKGKIFEGQH